MLWSAYRIRRQTAFFVGMYALVVAATVGTGMAVAESANPFADRFPNLVLRTHEGRNVRFYDDLLKGKIVLINFMYATCTER